MIWGTNAVHTQVNVMTHALRARKERGAKIVAVDIYMNATMKQADMALVVRPGTDGALACAVMHVLFRDGHADRDYLARYADCPDELEAHLRTRDPRWAAAITGLSVAEIEAFAKLVGERKRSFFRLGYGFARQRNGAVAMHAALSIPTVTGAWQYEGGGAFHSNSGIFGWRKTLIEGLDAADPSVRQLDQSQIGRVLTGDAEALRRGPPVTAMLIQNTNPVSVAPEQELVKRGFKRDDLFVCVHEQFMTETAEMADIVLPATMFMEHDDLYQAGGNQHILLGPKLVDPPGECRSNHEVIAGLAQRLGADHPGFAMTARALIDRTLRESGHGNLAELEAARWLDVQPPFRESHYLDGFAHPDRRFRFKPDWAGARGAGLGPFGPWTSLPALPDHCGIIEGATEALSLPSRHQPGASVPELELQRDPHLPRQGGPAGGDDASRRRRIGRHRRRRLGEAPQRARRGSHPRPLVRRRAARRADRRRIMAERSLPGRTRHQHAHRRRCGRAIRGRCLPRQPRGAGARRHLAGSITVIPGRCEASTWAHGCNRQ